MKKTLFTLLCLFIAGATLWAQSLPRQVLATAGHRSVAGSITLDWTLGQPGPVAMYSTPSFKLTQGYQQGDEWWVSINGNVVPYTKIKVYPNPSSGKFNISGTLPDEGVCHYFITDGIGNIIQQGEFFPANDGELNASVDISLNPPGYYILKLYGGEGNRKYVCSFKVTLIQTNN